jgi:hypothetical protein
MTKTYPMSEAQREVNRKKALNKYRDKIKENEVFCDACCMIVKKISIAQHNKSKKHIENFKEYNGSYFDDMLALFEKFKQSNGSQEISMKIHDFIEDKYYDEDGCPYIPESKKFTDAKTVEEKEFADKDYAIMASIIEEKLNTLTDRTLANNLLEQLEDIDATSKDSRQKYLNIFRTINSPEKPKEIKTIEEPKQILASKPILKKIEPIQYLNEEFPEYDKFIKATDKAKYDCLEYIVYNHQQIFEEDDYKKLTNALEEDEDEIEYNYIYEQVLKSKKEYELEERRQKSRINYFDNSDEEEEQEEEEEDDF